MKKLFLLAVIMMVFSCKTEEEIPAGIMAKEDMVAALIEIRTIEGQVASLSIDSDSSKVLYFFLEKRLFREMGLDSAIYAKSFNYYILHPEEFLDITSAVIDSLKLRSQKLSLPGSANK